jgi:hypothetical protein
MAEAVRVKTEKSWRVFRLKPSEFQDSENVFRVFMMEHVLRMQYGVKYDPLVADITASGKKWISDDSTEIFIHGVLSEKRTGTCSSLPTFSIAIGRRLGYPLKLVRVPNHTFFRWDDATEKFNHQHTDCGGEIKTDEFFYGFPRKWNQEDFAMNARTKVWLHSLTPMQEVSKFLCNRTLVLRDTERFEEGLEAIAAAERFDPTNPACAQIAMNILDMMTARKIFPRKRHEMLSLGELSVRRWMPMEPGPDQLLEVLNPFRDKRNDPQHLQVRMTQMGESLPTISVPEKCIAGRRGSDDCNR